MDNFIVFVLFVCFYTNGESLNLPGPRVYVVTPSPRPAGAGDARAAPFYYHNWMRRMDSPQNVTTTTTTETPDLIFAEFESGNNKKSIRKLLEREKIAPKTTTTTTTTTMRPVYVTFNSDDAKTSSEDMDNKQYNAKPVDMTDYFALYNNLYNPHSAVQAPVYVPPATSTTAAPPTTSTSTTTASPGPGVENIWHIIDSQKQEQYSGQWEEIPLGGETTTTSVPEQTDNNIVDDDHPGFDENFALPGFATNPGNGAENESRAIHSESNMRFPYINLKPFQMKNSKRPSVNSFSNSKKGNNLYASLDDFQEVKNPVRGEAQDVMSRQPIDRYNPAQPYLPVYDSKSKQSGPSPPQKAVANLVPPPPPPRPKITDGNFPAPSSYESFPPYVPSNPPATPAAPPALPVPTPSISYELPLDSADDSGTDSDSAGDSDSPPTDVEYRYKPPSAPSQPFFPTIPPPPSKTSYDTPMSKPITEYHYDKPISKPFPGYSYDKPPITDNSPPAISFDKPSFAGYHYNKPLSAYFHDDDHDHGHDHSHDHPPSDDHVHDDDHDLHHHYHHSPPQTTTEMPRVNRYSYYYLGKKLYYLPLYFSVYFIVYVGALIIKAVLRHKIVYPNSWRPNDQTASFFSKRSVDSWDFSNENLHEITGRVTHAIAEAGKKYFAQKKKK